MQNRIKIGVEEVWRGFGQFLFSIASCFFSFATGGKLTNTD